MMTQSYNVKLHFNIFQTSCTKKNFFNETNVFDKFYPSGSAPAQIYSTPKLHKFSSSDSFINLRPTVSFIGTFDYNLAHFLCDILSLLVPNGYPCKDTFSFVSQIKSANSSRKFLVSNFATCLFTDISLQQTIDAGIIPISNQNQNLNSTKTELKKFSILLHHILISFLTVNFIIKFMGQTWILLWLLSLLIFS